VVERIVVRGVIVASFSDKPIRVPVIPSKETPPCKAVTDWREINTTSSHQILSDNNQLNSSRLNDNLRITSNYLFVYPKTQNLKPKPKCLLHQPAVARAAKTASGV
jgi:hypothetical protein